MPDGRVRRRLSLADIPIYTGRRGPRPSFSTGPELRRIKRSTHQSDATACADAKRPMRETSACADIRTLFGRRGDRQNLYLSLGAIARHILAPTT